MAKDTTKGAEDELRKLCEGRRGKFVEVPAGLLGEATKSCKGQRGKDLHMGATRALGSPLTKGRRVVMVTCHADHILEALGEAKPNADV